MPILASVGGWLAKNALGLLGAGGAIMQNRGASHQAQRAMDFSERMSSTAAQRAVKDYAAAGLNPALAYDRPASSPGGSVAPVENAVSSGLSAKQAMANIELTKAQAQKVQAEKMLVDSEIDIRQVTEGDEPTWRAEQIAKRRAALRDIEHRGRLQPSDERLRALQVLLMKAGLRGADFRAETFSDMDAVRDFIRNGLSSAGSAAEAFGAWKNAAKSRLAGYEYGNRAYDAARAVKKRKPQGGGW